MSYPGAIPGYYCGFSLKTWTISRADIYVTGHNGSQSQPGYLPVRLEKSEKRNIDIHLVLCSDSGSQLFKVCLCVKVCVLMSDVQYYPLSNNFPSSKSHMFTNWFYMTCSHTQGLPRRGSFGPRFSTIDGDDNCTVVKLDTRLTTSFQ